ncbi:helix-turn-helix protein [Enterococcus hirae EnGen0127]|nr:helix-turn-helix protein [Enterococcus hirae EnGen0127]
MILTKNVKYFPRTKGNVDMITFERIKELAKQQGKSLNKIEEELGYGKNVLYRLKDSKPSAERLEELANYFDVSVDYLLGRTEKKRYYDLTEKDERDIQKELQSLIDDLSNADGMAFSKKDGEMSESTREALIISLENALRISKIEAKKKYTPKKYRD